MVRDSSKSNSIKTDKIHFISENIEEVVSELFEIIKSCGEVKSDIDLRKNAEIILVDWKKCQRIFKLRTVNEPGFT